MNMERIDIETFERVSSGINDVIQKFTDQMVSAEEARILREGKVSIVGVVVQVNERGREPEQVMLPHEATEVLQNALAEYYEKKSRE